MAHILIVDDERDLGALIARLLDDHGHTTQWVASGEAALEAASERRPDLLLLDMCLGGMDGIETLRRLRPLIPSAPIVMMTAFGNVPSAVNAMRLGATDFVSKPFSNQVLLSSIEALLAMRRPSRRDGPMLVGESPAFCKAMELALRFAVPDINILLMGETGTGKELFARAIHAGSKRRNGPFVAVDCSMLAENLLESELFGHEKGAFTGATASRIGRFEMAQEGTLFLDEIGNLPAPFQAKLLRVLQERRMERVGGRETLKLDVRVVAATNVNLKEAIAAGRFRQDLYYRLQEMTIFLPPLREREGDLGRIAQHFVTLYAERFGTAVHGISDGALELIEGYDWPGNVRELENAIKSAVVLATDLVRVEHLPPELRGGAGDVAATPSLSSDGEGERLKVEIEIGLRASEIDLKALGAEAAEQAERSLLTALLRRGRTSGAQLAKLLGIDPKTLRNKLRRYGLETSRDDVVAVPEKVHAGRLLVVDDEENLCWVLSKVLSARGHTVRTAHCSARALQALEDFDCQVAVVDYRLPDSNGISLIIEMAARFPLMRCILMTSYGSAAIRQHARDENVFACFDKPFKNDRMIETIEAGIGVWETGEPTGTRSFTGASRPDRANV